MRNAVTNLLVAIVAVIVAVTAGACNSTGCLDNQSAIPLAQFRSSLTGNAVTVSGMQIHGIGAPGDSVLVGATQSVSEVYLPMRSQATATAWCLTYASGDPGTLPPTDTITFDYTSRPFFASEECGAMYEYTVRGVRTTHTRIDSVVMLDTVITNIDRVTVAIYFREEPDSPDEPDVPDNPEDTEEGGQQ